VPQVRGEDAIIAFIEECAVVKKILVSMDLWEILLEPLQNHSPRTSLSDMNMNVPLDGYLPSLNRLVMLRTERA